MKSRSIIFTAILIVIAVYVTVGRSAGRWLIKDDTPVHADAIVLLTGSIADRVLHAVDLYQKGVSDKVIIVESGMGSFKELVERGAEIISGTEQICNAAADLGISEEHIVLLKGNAQSTQHEALIVREYLNKNPGPDTILLVTSAHHTRRASMIFRTAFRDQNPQVSILCSPSTYSSFDAPKWWRNKEGIQKVMMEYMKISNFLLADKRKLRER